MTRSKILGLVLVGLVAVGFVILSTCQIPAPGTAINKVISKDDLPK